MSPASTPVARIRQEAVSLILLGGPVIAAQLAQMSMNVVDTVMAGNLSAQDLASVAVGGSVWMPVFVLGMGILLAVSPMVGQCFGAGQYTEIGGHVRQGLWLSQGLAIISLLVIRNADPVFRWMQVDPEIVPTAIGYLNAVAWGMPAACAYTVLRSFSEAVSRTRPLMFISLIGLLANIAGNYIFMHGHLGMPRLGAVGCGVATALVMWIMLACLIAWICWYPEYRRFSLFRAVEGPRLSELWTLLRLGTPIGISLFMEGSLFSSVSLLMGRLGTDVVAGHQVALNVASVTFMVPLGISIAISVRVGQAIGAGDYSGARRSGTIGAGLAVGFMSLAALAMALVPQQIAKIYTDDHDVQRVAASLLAMAAIFQIFDGLQVAGAGALRGAKDTAVPMSITLLAYWGLGLPLGYWLGIVGGGGPQALWVGLIVGLMAAAILLNVRFQILARRLFRPQPQD